MRKVNQLLGSFTIELDLCLIAKNIQVQNQLNPILSFYMNL